jgi:hypothetical protein
VIPTNAFRSNLELPDTYKMGRQSGDRSAWQASKSAAQKISTPARTGGLSRAVNGKRF